MLPSLRDIWDWIEREPIAKILIGFVTLAALIFFSFLWYKAFVLHSFKRVTTESTVTPESSAPSSRTEVDTLRKNKIDPKKLEPKKEPKKMEPKNDESKKEVPKGDTYDVKSYDQKGGITAGRIDKVEIKLSENDIDAYDQANFVHEDDRANKRIKIWFKGGRWNNPSVAYPASEEAEVNGHFSYASGIILAPSSHGHTDLGPDRYAFFDSAQPVTRDNYLIFTYEKRPSVIMIGSKMVFQYGLRLD